nr:gliding motility-associated C-terminal domain-containing protein [uncultured Marinifilum sp.]
MNKKLYALVPSLILPFCLLFLSPYKVWLNFIEYSTHEVISDVFINASNRSANFTKTYIDNTEFSTCKHEPEYFYSNRLSQVKNVNYDSRDLRMDVPLPPFCIAGLDGEVCISEVSYTITGSTSVNVSSILWTTSGDGNFDDATIDNPTYNFGENDEGTTLVLTKTVYGTEVYSSETYADSLELKVLEQPIADAGTGGNSCSFTYSLLEAFPSVGVGMWSKVSGPGNVVFDDINDPESRVTVDLLGTYVFRWTEENGTCSDSDDVEVNFYKQPNVNAGPDGNTCGLLEYQLAATSSTGSGTWSKISGAGNATFIPNVNDPNAKLEVDMYDVYEFEWMEKTDACIDSDNIKIGFYQQPDANAGSDKEICGLEFELEAVASVGTGTWTKTLGSGTATFTPNENAPNATVEVSTEDTYEFTWTEIEGTCSDSDAVSVTFKPSPEPNAGSDDAICGLVYDLAAVPSIGTGTWTKTSGSGTATFTPNENDPNARVEVSVEDTYEFTWTEVEGTCSDSDAVSIKFNPVPTANAGSDDAICGLVYDLAAVPSIGTGTWTKTSGSGTATFTPNENAPNATVTVSTEDTYEFIWTEIEGICSDSDAVSITFKPSPEPNAGSDDAICGLVYDLAAVPSIGTGTWTKTSGSGTATFTPNENDPNARVEVSVEDTYEFTWTEVEGTCSDSDAVSIKFNPVPTANAGSDDAICGLVYDLAAVPSIGTGTWTKTSGSGTATFTPNENAPNATVTVSTEDTYEFIWTEIEGICSDSDAVSITFKPSPEPNAGSDDAICGLVYDLDAVPSIGTGTWTKTSGSGMATFTPDINSPNAKVEVSVEDTYEFTWTEIEGTCSDLDAVSITFNPVPTANAGSDDAICGLVYDLAAIPSIGTGTWTKTSGSGTATFTPDINDANARVEVSVEDTYEFTWTEVEGTCSDSDAVSVTFNPVPTANAGSDDAICGLVYDLSAIPSIGTGTWTKTSGSGTATFTPNENAPNARVEVSSEDTYEFTWTEVEGTCSDLDAVSITFNSVPTANAGSDDAICGLVYNLAAIPSIGTGTWTKTSGSGTATFTPDINDANARVEVSTEDTYEFTWTEIEGTCSDSDAVSITFNPVPSANAGSDDAICGLVYDLAAVPSIGTGTWTKNSGSGTATFTPNENDPNTRVEVSVEDTYEFTWTEIAGTCSDSDAVSVTFNPVPTANAGSDDAICGLVYDLAAVPSIGTGTWTKTSGSGTATFTPNENDPNARVEVSVEDTYEFTWTEVEGTCSDSDAVSIKFNPVPTANAGSDDAICGLVYDLAAVPSIGTGTWTKTSGSGTATFTPNENAPNATVTVSTEDTYEFIWTEIEGICSDSDAVSITFKPSPEPNAGSDDAICGLVYDLDAVPSIGTGTWTKTSGSGMATFTPDINSPNAKVEVSVEDTYEFTWTEIEGTCSDLDAVSITFNPVPTANAGSDDAICGLVYDLAAIPSIGTGTWTKTSGSGTATFTPDINDANARVEVSVEDTYEFTWTEVEGTCSDLDVVSITFNPVPTANAGSDDAICGLVYDLAAIPSIGTGTWTKTSGSGTATFTPDINDANARVEVSVEDTYEFTWTEIEGTCSDSDAVSVTFNPVPTTNAGSDDAICGLVYDLAAVPSIGTGTWTKTSGLGMATFTPDINSPNAKVEVSSEDTYEFTWTEIEGTCSDSDAVSITFNPVPTANAGSDDAICGLVYDLAAVPSIGTGTWTKTSGSGTATFTPDINDANARVEVSTEDTYEFTWTEIEGTCSDSDAVSITFNPVPTANAGSDDAICGLVYDLAAVPSIGTGTWTKTSGSGTATFTPDINDANARVEVSVEDTYEFTWTEIEGTCSDSDAVSVTFNPVPTANAGSDDAICGLVYDLAAVPSIGTGTWTKTSGSGTATFTPDINDANARVEVSSEDTYEFTWTEIEGTCSDSDAVSVTFNPVPTANAGSDDAICGLVYDLAAVPSIGTGTWTKTSGSGTATFTPNENAPNARVEVSSEDTYEFTWTEIEGTCSDSDAVSITFNSVPTANAGSDDAICGLVYDLSAIPSIGTGTWTKTSGSGTATFTPNENAPNARVEVSSEDTYEFTWTEIEGTCSDLDAVSITFNSVPTANAGSDDAICGLVYDLAAIPSIGTGTWTKTSGSGTATFTPNENDPNARVEVSEADSYSFTWTEIEGTCSDSDVVSIIFYDAPISCDSESMEICGEEVALNIPYSNLSGQWSLISGDGNIEYLPDNTSRNVTIKVDKPGDYVVSWEEQNEQCSSQCEYNISFYEQPVADAGDDIFLDFSKRVKLISILSTNGNGTWSILSGHADIDNYLASETYAENFSLGENILQWTEQNYICEDSDEVSIHIDGLFIPQVITPNGDGKNDFFVIRGIQQIGNIEFMVFNRTGMEVYKTLDYKNDWNGFTKDGKQLMMGTYFYIVRLESGKVYKGSIVIKK